MTTYNIDNDPLIRAIIERVRIAERNESRADFKSPEEEKYAMEIREARIELGEIINQLDIRGVNVIGDHKWFSVRRMNPFIITLRLDGRDKELEDIK
jgi:hypothetical protein